MNTLNIMIWNDATVKGNDVECLVSIDMQDVAMLVTAELQKITGKNYAHWEVKGLTDEPFIADGVKSVAISEDEIIANQALIAKQAEQIKMHKNQIAKIIMLHKQSGLGGDSSVDALFELADFIE